MPRQKRKPFIPGKIYHVYNRGNRRLPVFIHMSDRAFFVRKTRYLCHPRVCNIELISYCLMDNHYHLVLRQGHTVPISKLMQRLLTSYALYFNAKHATVGHIFQGRYKGKPVVSGFGLVRLLDYVRDNPVEAQYTENPDYYRWLYIKPEYDPRRD